MPSRNQLMQYVAPMPDRIEVVPGAINGVDAVMPHFEALYHTDPEFPGLVGSLDAGSSPSSKVCFDQAFASQKIKAHAKKNGDSALISNANLAMISRWASWCARRFGVARSQRLTNAKQAMLASQAQPDPTPAE